MGTLNYISNDPEDTKKIASDFSGTLKPGSVVCLYGGLGAGKTAFVQGLAKGLGVTEYITSPTFTIVNVYESGRVPLYHFDMYRLADCDEAYEIGYEEYVYGGGISVMEWPENVADILPESRYDITISKDDGRGTDFRKIDIIKVGK